MPLTPTSPLASEGLDRLRASSVEELVGGPITSRRFSDCVRSALFLYFSAIAESHAISQSISSPTGSLLHGIMHRQEPDFLNSKYWFRRAGQHELFPILRDNALEKLRLIGSNPAEQLASEVENRMEWDPLWFIDKCEFVNRDVTGKPKQLLMELQLIEWQIVFKYCLHGASRSD